jgi:L-amino acid N-acyltransferase YncA
VVLPAIRPATAADGSRAFAALAEWMPEQRARQLAPSLRPAGGSEIVYVADDPDGTLAGFIIAVAPERSSGAGYIHFVWVAPASRGAGLGRELYAAALAELRRRNCRQVLAVVAERNHGGLRFHARLGFRPVVDPGFDVPDRPGGPSVTLALRL